MIQVLSNKTSKSILKNVCRLKQTEADLELQTLGRAARRLVVQQ